MRRLTSQRSAARWRSQMITVIISRAASRGTRLASGEIESPNSHLEMPALAAAISIILAISAAVASHVCVRNVQGRARLLTFGLALGCLGLSFYFGRAMGGLWTGIYTLLSIYFLVCMMTPWLALAWEKHHVR